MRKTLLVTLLFSIPLSGFCADHWRTFTDYRGRKVEAKILSVESDFVVVELKQSGRQLPIDFDKLSEKDVTFLQNYEEPEPADESSESGKTNAPNPTDDDTVPAGDPKTGRLYPRSKEEIRTGIRAIKKRPKPHKVSREVHEATENLNIFRFLCGVPSDVESDVEFSANAEDAAIACKEFGSLSHGLGHSTGKCNLSSSGDMVASVAQYIEDSGDNNRDARGHRAWCLNPPMGRVGFGSAGDSFSGMWCMDGSGKSIRGPWAYPGMGLFPLDYMHGNAWSLYGAGVPSSADKVKIKIHRLYKRPEKPFSATAEIPGREIAVNHVSLAMNGINFEPEEPAKRGTYWVRVSGGGIREAYLVELY